MKKAVKRETVKVKAADLLLFRGANFEALKATDHELVNSGPADTGKTMACCAKLHALCIASPGAQCAIVRKSYSSIAGTVLKTFWRVIQQQGHQAHVRVYGGETPSRFIYSNGANIWVGGMDNPDRVLSSERDMIYVNQTEELSLNDWETLATRCSGRAAVVENPQLLGDCNPGGSRHWIRLRADAGKLRLLVTTHRDNPTIYGRNGELTESGKARLAVLENLTGVRRKRLMEGTWATAEGAVYEMFDVQHHRTERSRADMKRFFLAMDEGYTNPAVILVIGEDADTRWHCFREFYKRGVLQNDVVSVAAEWFKEFGCELAAVDESAAGLIADLQARGVRAVGGKGRVLDGIQAVQNRLKIQKDGRPRYTVAAECSNHINEFESYVWKPEKDVPNKEDDHSLDAVRYLHDVLAVPTGAFASAAGLFVPSRGGLEATAPEVFVADRLDGGDWSR